MSKAAHLATSVQGPEGRRIELVRMGWRRKLQLRSVGYADEGLHYPKGWSLSETEKKWLIEMAARVRNAERSRR